MHISDKTKYIGVNDERDVLFEGQYRVPNGISYNSYLIDDERLAVLDTVDAHFVDEWLAKLSAELGGREPDYLVVHHVEPDHSAGIGRFAEKYPNAKIVASQKAFAMMKSFYGDDFADRRIVAAEGSELSLGEHKLTFITAPMVHWPEVIVSYESSEAILFSADGFGAFGVPDEGCTAWDDEARRYYIGIVGKYGANVQALLRKAAALDIGKICPLHGPVLEGERVAHCVKLYDLWSRYEAECDETVIAYASVYGNTKRAALRLGDELTARGRSVKLYDLSYCDKAEAVAEAFKADKLVLASVTYNADVFPPMREFINALTERNFKNRRLALIENGSWGPTAAKVMRAMLADSKELSFADTAVTLRSALDDESLASIIRLADELATR